MIKKITKLDNSIEFKIVLSAIISTEFLKQIKDIYKSEYITNKYAKLILSWCLKYYNDYEIAPQRDITELYNNKKDDLEEATAKLIAMTLERVEADYLNTEKFNTEYYLDQATKYFKNQSLSILSKNIQRYVINEEPERAEDELLNYRKVEKRLSGWYKPLSVEIVDETFDNRTKDILFKFPGALGELLGYFERGYLVPILAPPKRGKTTLLYEIGIQALRHRLKVAIINIEMPKNKKNMRLFQRYTNQVAEGKGGEYNIPVFDCMWNQTCECVKKNRVKNKTMVLLKNGLLDFEDNLNHKICNICRGGKDYVPSVWYKKKTKNEITKENAIKSIEKYNKWNGDLDRAITYPRFSVTMEDILRDLSVLEQSENFIPDVVLFDYPAITVNDKNESMRHFLSKVFKICGRIATEKHCAVFVPHQGNRDSMDATSMKLNMTSETMAPLTDCDQIIFENQTDFEKKDQCMRIATFKRHDGYIMSQEVKVLQDMSSGRFCIDSEWMPMKGG